MRVLPDGFVPAVTAGLVVPAVFADLTFRSTTEHVWTGIGPIAFNGNTYKGVGTLGGIGTISEGINVQAQGTSVSLSGIDPEIYAECMADIQIGAPATLWFGALAAGVFVCYRAFQGQVDKPSVTTGGDSIAISLALENRLYNMQRPSYRRYTTEDQHLDYADDCGFSWVTMLNDIALLVGN
jgi:hypothetical protein